MTDLYSILGVSKKADAKEISRAYRKVAKSHHPDAGGSPERFREIELAKRILTDDARRKEYDATGTIDEASIENEQAQILEVLAQFSGALIQQTQFDLTHQSFVGAMKEQLNGKIIEGEQAPAKYDLLIKRFDTVLKRLKRKGKNGNGALIAVITSQRNSIDAAKKRDQETVERFKKALAYLKDYDYEVDRHTAQSPYMQTYSGLFTSTGTTGTRQR